MIEKHLHGCDCSAPAVSGVHQRSRSDDPCQGCAAVRLIPLPPCMRLTFIESHSQAEMDEFLLRQRFASLLVWCASDITVTESRSLPGIWKTPLSTLLSACTRGCQAMVPRLLH